MALSLQRRGLARDAHTIGNEELVDLLELDGEQTIKAVLQTYIALAKPLSHAGGHAPESA
jgi:hypothetical protein